MGPGLYPAVDSLWMQDVPSSLGAGQRDGTALESD